MNVCNPSVCGVENLPLNESIEASSVDSEVLWYLGDGTQILSQFPN